MKGDVLVVSRNNLKKITIIIILLALGFISGFGVYKYNKVQAYNTLITTANKYMDSGEYDKAIALFNQSLQYKNDANIQRSIKLAASLKEIKVIYDNGTKLMNDKKYLEAIEQFNKITKEDEKLYSSAQKNIEECKKSFITQNIELANTALKNNQYDEANKYLDSIMKIDANNEAAKKIKDTITKLQDEQQEKQNKQSTVNNKDRKITFEQASNIVLNSIKDKGSNTIIVQEGEDIKNKNGVDYYIIHVADNMGDHIATRAWYYVEVNTGKAYEWDLANNKLIPLE